MKKPNNLIYAQKNVTIDKELKLGLKQHLLNKSHCSSRANEMTFSFRGNIYVPLPEYLKQTTALVSPRSKIKISAKLISSS